MSQSILLLLRFLLSRIRIDLVMSTVLEALGFFALIGAAVLVSPILGLAAFGVVLLIVGALFEER